MNSSRFLMALLSTILKSAFCAFCVGESRLLRDPEVIRFASSGSDILTHPGEQWT